MLFFFFKKKNTALNNQEIKYIAIFLPKRREIRGGKNVLRNYGEKQLNVFYNQVGRAMSFKKRDPSVKHPSKAFH